MISKESIKKIYLLSGHKNIPLTCRINTYYSKLRAKRNVLFLHNSYYHYYYLSIALRKRGWNAVTVSYEDPVNGGNTNYYHGEDINIFHPNPSILHSNALILYNWALSNFNMLHFAGDGLMSFFPSNWNSDAPEDIIKWKEMGRKLAYTISGCKSCISQSSYEKWSQLDSAHSACSSCRWQHEHNVCSDENNLKWGAKVARFCDLICAETAPALDYLDSDNTVFNPLTMCLDSDFWKPDLVIPDKFKLDRQNNEFIVYHGVGNYEMRIKDDGRNIKGTGAIIAAIEKLKSEGLNIRLVFATDMKNQEVRFLQAQSDVIVDQLILGEYGATAREGMMLGKPVICYLNQKGYFHNKFNMSWRKEVPLVSATEETVYCTLKDLLLNPEKRYKIGGEGRDYAMKWHSADACAQRYEAIYDQLMKQEKN